MMRWTAIALLTFVFACAGSASQTGSQEQSEPQVQDGRKKALALGAPLVRAAVAMQNVDGTMVSIDSVRGPKGTLVVFTCNHCPWSRIWESRIVELGNAYAARGIGVIAINPNDPRTYEEDSFVDMQERARAAGMTFPYVVDESGEVARAFGATKTPEVFVFDDAQRLVYHGAVDDNANDPDQVQRRYLEEALKAVVAGTDVPHPKTKALGCSIKLRDGSG